MEPGTTKNREARQFSFTSDLRALLESQKAKAVKLAKHGKICPWVFFHYTFRKNGRPSFLNGKPVGEFKHSWHTACTKAGLPGRLMHDFRRTAVMEKEGQGGPEIITRTELSPGDPRFPHPAPLGGSSAFIANTGRVTYRAESFAFFTFAFPWPATAVPCFFGYVIRFTSGRDQRPPPGIPPPTLRFSLSSSPESVPVHDIFISWPPT